MVYIVLRNKKVSVAIPASVVSDIPHLRERTSKIGFIGRSAAIFGVEEIIIYQDTLEANQKADADLIFTLLCYIETPQYLRKRLFRLKPELRYAGILPPLRTPHHPLNQQIKGLNIGEYREGVVVSKSKKGAFVDIGVEKAALVPKVQATLGKRVTVRIENVSKHVVARLADRSEIPFYWGYNVVKWLGSFGEMVKERMFDLKIATSKYGFPFAECKDKIAEKWSKANTVLVAFGAPAHGLYELAKHEGLNLDDLVDFVVNTVPNQKTETVRTEEALMASLAVLNVVFGFKV